MGKDYTTAVFNKSPLFGHFRKGLLDKLADACESVDYPAGALVFSEGDMPEAMLIIDEGTIDIVKRVDETKGLVLAHVESGDIVEVNSFMDGRAHFVSAITTSPTRLIKIPTKVFTDITATDPQAEHRVLLEILKIQSAGLRTLNVRFKEFLSRVAG